MKDITKFTKQVAAELNKIYRTHNWQYVPPDSDNSYPRLRSKQYEIRVQRDGLPHWPVVDINFSGLFTASDGHQYMENPFKPVNGYSIWVKSNRTPASVARSLKRRLLPAYFKAVNHLQ
jgi:hypothetical protein